MEAQVKDDFDDDEGIGGIDGDDYMDTNMDDGTQFVTPTYSTNGEPKKQSQLGLVHHHSNPMDLRTIMNLDLETDLFVSLDETTGIDLDMCLDLERYHRKRSFENDVGGGDDDEVNEEKDHDEIYFGKQIPFAVFDGGELDDGGEERMDMDMDMDMDVKGDVDEGGIAVEGDEPVVRVRESKGKDIDRGGDAYGYHHHHHHHHHQQSKHFVTSGTAATTYSTSYESTTSASSSSSGSSSSSSSSSSSRLIKEGSVQDGYVSLQAAEARVLDAFHCTPLLPALPIPSRMGETDNIVDDKAQASHNPVSISVAAGACSSSESIAESPFNNSQAKPQGAEEDAMDGPASGEARIAAMEEIVEQVAHMEELQDQEMSLPDLSLFPEAEFIIDGTSGTTATDAMLAALNPPSTSTVTPLAPAPVPVVLDEASLAWTKHSRLEQVNVECCSNLSLVTMTKIKTLGQDRQAELERQGRKKSRIWMENEHDMMMARLAVERGPDLPAERLVARVSTIAGSSGSSSGSGSRVALDSAATAEEQGVTTVDETEVVISDMELQQPLLPQPQEQDLQAVSAADVDEPMSSEELPVAVQAIT
jgi:hypothetical protein